MKKNIRAEFRPDSIDFLNFIIRHFKTFLITGLLAAVISGSVSLALKPLFESTVILYPSSNVVETNNLLGGGSPYTSVFGDEEATERLLQILKSDQVKDYLKQKYDLMDHYGIKDGEKYPNTKMEQKMNKYVHSSKTSFGSVEIRVRDRDRNTACLMANDIAAMADTIFNSVQRETAAKLLTGITKSYRDQLKLVRMYEDTLRAIIGVNNNRDKAGGTLYKAFFEAVITGDKTAQNQLESQMNLYKTDSPEFLRVYSTLKSETDYLSLIRGRYIESLALSRQTLPYTLIIDKAVVAEKKIWPKRSYITIIATFSSLLLLALMLFISDSLILHRENVSK